MQVGGLVSTPAGSTAQACQLRERHLQPHAAQSGNRQTHITTVLCAVAFGMSQKLGCKLAVREAPQQSMTRSLHAYFQGKVLDIHGTAGCCARLPGTAAPHAGTAPEAATHSRRS